MRWMIYVELVCVFSFLPVSNVNACDVETSAILFNCFVDMQIDEEPVCVFFFLDQSL